MSFKYDLAVNSDLGADVIKTHGLHDGYWTRTRDVLEGLIARADVIAHNMRPGAAERLGIGDEDLRARYPRPIYCHARGFEAGPGRPGPARTRSPTPSPAPSTRTGPAASAAHSCGAGSTWATPATATSGPPR